MFQIVDRYVLGEWIKIFILVLAAILGLQLLGEVQDSFADLLEFDATFGTIIFYYTILFPSFLTISLPVAVLVSILYALGHLHANNELVAFRSAGMSVFRVTRSIWYSGVLMSILLWFLNASLIPWSVEQSRIIWDNLELEFQAKTIDEDKVGVVKNLSFDNRKESRMWFMNRFSRYTNEGYGIRLAFMDDDRLLIRQVLAKSGYYDDIDKHWVVEEGVDNLYATEGEDFGELIRAKPFDRLVLEDIDDDPNLMMLLDKRPQDLSYIELKTITENFERGDNVKILAYQARLHALMASAASCLIVVGIAIPFAISGVRVNPAVGVSKSLGLFIGYFILASVNRHNHLTWVLVT